MVAWTDVQTIILVVFRLIFTVLIILSLLINVLAGLIAYLFVPLDITLIEFCRAVSQTIKHKHEGEL